MRRIAIVLGLMLAAGAAAAEECEKIQNIAIMWRTYACTKPATYGFWISDLTAATRDELPEYSKKCATMETANQPHYCTNSARPSSDSLVFIYSFLAKKHFCNFAMPAHKRDNLIRNSNLTMAEPNGHGLQPMRGSGAQAFDYFYAHLAPEGQTLVACRRGGHTCTLEAITEDGNYMVEINFLRKELANWKALLAKTMTVTAKCM